MAPLHWWSADKCPIRLVVIRELFPYISTKECPLRLVAIREMPLCFDGQWKSVPLHWWSMEKCPLKLVIRVPYTEISEELPP